VATAAYRAALTSRRTLASFCGKALAQCATAQPRVGGAKLSGGNAETGDYPIATFRSELRLAARL